MLVYLDQSVLSNLAKRTSFVSMNDLEALVKTDRVLFPFSWTHWREAQLDTEVERVIFDTAARLSRGIHFITPALIVAGQAKRAYLQWRGENGHGLERRQGYEHDPDGPISERLADSMRHARVVQNSESRELSRANKELFARSLGEDRERRGPAKSFEEAKGRYAEESVRLYFENPQRQALTGKVDDLVMAMLQYSELVAESAVGPIGHPCSPEEAFVEIASMFQFFESDRCKEMPFIDIGSSLYSSLEFDEKDRTYSLGDMFDIETWATYLPYVDMAVADRHMAQLLNKRGLAAKYGCQVFPHTAAGLGQLVEAVNELVQD